MGVVLAPNSFPIWGKKDIMRKILPVVFVCGLMTAFAPTLQAAAIFGQFFNGAATGLQLGNGPVYARVVV